jgi:hypothetical protein
VHKSHWPVCLGIVVNLWSETRTFSLHGFYPIVDDDDECKNARVDIFTGLWDVDNISRLLFTIQRFLAVDQSSFVPPSLDKSLFVGNVLMTTVNHVKTVMKVFDGRFRISPLKRDCQPSLLFIANCNFFFQKENLTIISYPFIEGGHSPSNSLQIMSLLQKLIHFHSENYVLTDIRGSNIVFGNGNNDAFFIDFDYCGKEGTIRYPENFNVTNISDGKRHSEVKTGVLMQRRHDCFSLAETLKLYTLKDKSHLSHWNKVLNEILVGTLNDAWEVLRANSVFEFISY